MLTFNLLMRGTISLDEGGTHWREPKMKKKNPAAGEATGQEQVELYDRFLVSSTVVDTHRHRLF